MNNQVHTQIVSFIWSIADDCLRDVYVRGKYRDVILPMTVIRRLDAMLEGTIENVRNTKKLLDEAKVDNQWPALCIAWLAYRLMELEKDAHPIFNSILVVTDRRILDKQIRDNIKQFAQVGNVVAWAEHSGDLRKAITDGKRIIITTIEKFPYVVPDIGAEHKDNKFAILIDEAHSGQNGRNSAQMNLALSGLASDNDMDNEDKINAMMEGRKLLKNHFPGS